MRLRASLLAAGLGLGLLPPTASASVFCVPTSAACPGGAGTAVANLETAASTNRGDGQADTIYIAANFTYTDPDTFGPASGSDPLTIVGAGPTSVITSSATTNIYAVNLNANGNAAPVTLKDVKIVVPTSFPDAGGKGSASYNDENDVFENVDVEVRNSGSSGLTMEGGVFRGGRIYATGAGVVIQDAIRPNITTSGVVEDALIEDARYGITVGNTGDSITVQRSTIVDPVYAGVEVNGGSATVRNTVITTSGTAKGVSARVLGAKNASVFGDHLTIVHSGGGAGIGAEALVEPAKTGNASTQVTNSIIRGYGATTYQRQAPVDGSLGDATLGISYSNFPPTGTSSGDGVATTTVGNINADPLFVSGSDFHLTAGSPSIDAGGASGTSVTDRDGNTRVVDGDENCTAVRDQGAYEFQGGVCHAPVVAGSAVGPTFTVGGTPVLVDPAIGLSDQDGGYLFSGTVTLLSPQPGEALSYQTTGGVNGSVSAGGDAVTFAGVYPPGTLAAAMSAVRFQATGGAGTTRSVTFKVNDGAQDSNVFTQTVAVAAAPGPSGGKPSQGGSTPDPGATSNVFKVVRKKRNANGTWTVAIKFPGKGTLQIRDRRQRLAPVRRAVSKAGTVRVRLRLRAAAASRLRRGSKLPARVRITFTPGGGKAATKTLRLVFIRR